MKKVACYTFFCAVAATFMVIQIGHAQRALQLTTPELATPDLPGQQSSPTQPPQEKFVEPTAAKFHSLNPLNLTLAQSRATASDQDIIVVVGAEWCEPCQTLKQSVFPQLAAQGKLDGIQFAYVDFDHQRESAMALMQGSMVPQIVYMRRGNSQFQPAAVIPRMAAAEEIGAMIDWVQTLPQPRPEPLPQPMLPPADSE